MKTMLKLIVLLILTGLLAPPQSQAAKKVDVLLKGQNEPISGYLREVSQSRYILQGSDRFYEFDAEELVSVDGKKSPPESALGHGKLVYSTLYERILPGGDVEVWMNMEVTNSGTTLIESIDWGAAEWELEETRTMEVRDPFGNILPVSVTPRDSGGYRIEVRLQVPVGPMENASLSVKKLRKEVAKPEADGGWSYTFNVDFNEDRFFVRKLEFPAGAVITVPEGWRKHELDERVFLHSYFYYPAHTVAPQTVRYRLP